MGLEATSPHSVAEVGNVAVAGKALQDSYDNSFPLEGLFNERDRFLISSARSDMVATMLWLDLEKIDIAFGTDVSSTKDVSDVVERGSFADAGTLIQEVLDSHRNDGGDEDKMNKLDALEKSFAARFRRMASRIDEREGIFGRLRNQMYHPKIRWLARLGL